MRMSDNELLDERINSGMKLKLKMGLENSISRFRSVRMSG
jgi:hypothetical protein